MDEYVYKNLDRYGNCYINYKTFKRKGKKDILKDLEEHGFICEIRLEKDSVTCIGEIINDVIIEVIRRKNKWKDK